MARQFHEGTQVDTKFGRGAVIRTEFSNILVHIFKTNTVVRIINDPKFINPIEDTPAPTEEDIEQVKIPKQTDLSDIEQNQTKQIKALDALRFGLVPHQLLPDLTFGFDQLEKWVLGCLPDKSEMPPKVAEVYGQYGTGKSHTMAVIRYIAKKNGYVTARVEVDGRGVTMADPAKLLSTLWGSLDAEGLCSPTPLLDLYCRAIDNNHAAPSLSKRGIDQLAHNYHMIRVLKSRGVLDLFENELDSIISSHDEITASELQRQIFKLPEVKTNGGILSVKKMIRHTLDERSYDFVKDLYGHALVCKLAGYKGLVVTIDEFEVEFLNKDSRKVIDLILALLKYVTGELQYRWAPCSLFIANIRSDGKESDAFVDLLVQHSKGEHYSLAELDLKAIEDIGERIHTLYKNAYCIGQAYEKGAAQRIYKEIETHSGRVRSFIKHYMNYLDDYYGPPSKS